MIIEMTYQVRVADFQEGRRWYEILLNRAPDFIPHEGFAEWELILGCWLQVAEGEPSKGSGPLRLGIKDVQKEKTRLMQELNVEDFEIFSRQEVPVKWGTFDDPWGNRLGLFEYKDKADEIARIKIVSGER